MYFNLDDISKGTAIRLARLRVYVPSMTAKGNGISVHLVTGLWNETVGGAEPKYDATPIVKMDAANLGSRRFVTVDVTAVVQNWINQKTVNEGFALVSVPTGSTAVAPASVVIAAKEGINSGLPAHLEIELADETKVGPAGPAGAPGPKGEPGVNGKSVLSGTVAPSSTTGMVGDFYLNTATGALSGPKTSTGWGTARALVGPKGDAGAQGPIGLTGAKGDVGPAGASGGRTILSGTMSPTTATGGIGDFYLNTATTGLYGPKTDKGWGTPKSLVGPAGPTGATGAQGLKGNTGATGPQGPQGLTGAQGPKGDAGAMGAVGPQGPIGLTGPQGMKGDTGVQGLTGANGKTIFSGTSAPTENSGGVGDFYLNTVTSAFYGPKTNEGWGTPKSLVGPKGDAGAQGPRGDAGATGLQGPIGLTGLKGDTGPVGPQGPQGLTGGTGATGPQGIQGAAGFDGKTILNGTIAPSSSVGNLGDFYLNTATSAFYGPKTASGWGSATSLVGPQGIQGAAGLDVSDLALISGEQAKLGLKPSSASTYVEYFTNRAGAYGSVDILTNAAHSDEAIIPNPNFNYNIPIPKFLESKSYRAFQQEVVKPSSGKSSFTYTPGCPVKFVYVFIWGTSQSQFSPGGKVDAVLTYIDDTTEILSASAYFGYYQTGFKELFLKPSKGGVAVKKITLDADSSGYISVALCYARTASVYLSARAGFFEPGKRYRALLDYALGGKDPGAISLISKSAEGDVEISTGPNWVTYPAQTGSACDNAKIEVRMAADTSTDEKAFDALRGVVILKQ